MTAAQLVSVIAGHLFSTGTAAIPYLGAVVAGLVSFAGVTLGIRVAWSLVVNGTRDDGMADFYANERYSYRS